MQLLFWGDPSALVLLAGGCELRVRGTGGVRHEGHWCIQGAKVTLGVAQGGGRHFLPGVVQMLG